MHNSICQNPKRKEVIPQWMKDKFGAVLDVFCLRQALKESNKMCDVCGEMVPLKVTRSCG